MTDYDYKIQASDIDWNAVALALGRKHGIGNFALAEEKHLGAQQEHYYRSRWDADLRILVDGDRFEAELIRFPHTEKQSSVVASGALDDLSLFAVEGYLRGALRHGLDSEPDHEVGDLQDFMRSMWAILTPEQKIEFARSESVLTTLEAAEGRDAEEYREKTFP